MDARRLRAAAPAERSFPRGPLLREAPLRPVAADCPDQVPENVKLRRLDRLMLAQQQVAFESAARRIGGRFDVLIDSVEADGHAIARHAGQAPEVDSVTHVYGDGLNPGRFAPVRCTGSQQYDLIAQPVSDTL